MRRLLAALLALTLLAPASSDAARIWGGWWRNVPPTSTSSTSSTSTSTTSSSSSSSTSTSTTSSTTSTGVVATTTSSSSSSSSTSTSSTTTSTVSPAIPLDWSPSFAAWWDAEEGAGATALANANTSCGAGTDCDLTDTNGVARDATNFVESMQSADFVAANNESWSCVDATCDELDCTGGGVTIGAWIRVASLTQAHRFFENFSGSVGGYIFLVNATTGTLTCQITDTNNVSTTSAAGTGTAVWVHAVCTLDDAADLIRIYMNAAQSGAGSTQQQCNGGDTLNFTISGASSLADMDGQIDEAFVIQQTLSATEICRVCSCGIDGTYCECDAGTPANFKACSTDADCDDFSAHGKCDTTSGTCQGRNHATDPGCGACTLPACNAAAP